MPSILIARESETVSIIIMSLLARAAPSHNVESLPSHLNSLLHRPTDKCPSFLSYAFLGPFTADAFDRRH